MKHAAFVLVALLLCSMFSFAQTIQKGEFSASVASEGWTLDKGVGDRTHIEFITFDKQFEAPPAVMVSLVGVDATSDQGGAVRVHLAVDKITKVGCVVKIKTWGNSKVGAVWGNYVAFGK